MAFYPSPEDHLWAQERTEKLLSCLSERQREVVVARFGLEGDEMTVRQCAEELGISQVRVRQIEHRALCVMEKHLEFVDSGMTQAQWDLKDAREEFLKRHKRILTESWEYPIPKKHSKTVITDDHRRAVALALKRARAKTSDPMILGLKRVLFIGTLIGEMLDIPRAAGLRVWRDVVEEERSK